MTVQRLVQHVGWAVQLTRKDGSTFLACGAQGNLTPIWVQKNRILATRHMKELESHGLDAKVVKVAYAEPRVLNEKAEARLPDSAASATKKENE